jgi:transcriptional regulator with XRE-family HTH domain
MSREELAAAANVSARTIGDFESRARRPIPATLAAIQTALESAGVIFTPENGDGPGVKLRKVK